MAKFDISPQATEDLFEIWEYTVSTWSENQADKYYATLISAIEEIGNNRKKAVSYDEIVPGLKAFHVRKHMVFFVIQGNGRPLIVRILHERMDYTRHLLD